jgi:hypothetical protein
MFGLWSESPSSSELAAKNQIISCHRQMFPQRLGQTDEDIFHGDGFEDSGALDKFYLDQFYFGQLRVPLAYYIARLAR